MAKVFTITAGLQNLGALKTGGQGSIYKALRSDGDVSAVKLLPTPVFDESSADNNYMNFQNEVQKLIHVNEEPNPNIVKIRSSGITESGSLPYIEMEFIEGPDLEELLRPPHDALFTIAETIKVATHLANALAQCHRRNVKHGDLKSNNIKLNNASGDYILLDFGLAMMSDEQRRTTMRQAGAIEFMAPEQSNGSILFQTDIYGLGIVLYELLGGRVPFPLQDRSEKARNQIMLAHMESPVPNLQALRSQNLPQSWSQQQRLAEERIPDWLLSLVFRCLEKDPDNRFRNGTDLRIFLEEDHSNHKAFTLQHGDVSADLKRQNEILLKENNSLAGLIKEYEAKLKNNYMPPVPPPPPYPGKAKTPWGGILLAAILTALIVGGLAYFLFHQPAGSKTPGSEEAPTEIKATPYKVLAAKTYFHDSPNPSTRRPAFVLSGSSIVGKDEQNGFVYTEYTNNKGQQSKGWLSKQDLVTDEVWQVIQNNQREKEQRIKNQLEEASNYLARNMVIEAVTIYASLSAEEIPEAMYQYANLALLGKHNNISCDEAISLLEEAQQKGYTAAKRTLGFLYVFAENKEVLSNGGYDQCTIQPNIIKGTQLLIQAIRDGDTTARDILDELNARRDSDN